MMKEVPVRLARGQVHPRAADNLRRQALYTFHPGVHVCVRACLVNLERSTGTVVTLLLQM